jgi:signal transduction histidine kinase
MFRLFADLIATHLDTAGRLAHAEANLLDARATSELRDQFIAVLGHDLRNPLASIAAGGRLLQKTALSDEAKSIMELIHKSVVRMTALIDNMMDLARGKLGGGIALTRTSDALEPTLHHVVDEMQMAYPGRMIDADIDISRPVHADRDRIARLLSNLLSNALAYGTQDAPVRVGASTKDVFELWVANQGPAIPATIRQKLFSPFTRGDVRPDQQGLGIGLYIVAEIARAHDGAMDITSTDDETRFTFRMPL